MTHDTTRRLHLRALAKRVRHRQAKLGLTNLVLGHLAGRTEHWIADLRAGQVDPKLTDAVALAAALRVDVQWLLGEEDGVNRRDALRAIGTGLVSLAIFPSDLVTLPPTARLVEDQTEYLRLLSGSYWKISLTELQRLHTEHQAHLLHLLRSAPTAAQSPLQSLAAETGRMAGLAAYDHEDPGTARQHFAQAAQLAIAAGDGVELASVLTAQRCVTSRTDARGGGDRIQGQQAVELLDSAERAAGSRAPRQVRGWLYCSRAEEWSALGRENEAMRDLDRALAALTAATAPDPPLGFTNTWDEEQLASWRASVLLYLDRPAEAADLLERVVKADSDAISPSLYPLANLAAAYAAAGEGERAVELGGRVLLLARQIGMAETIGRVQQIEGTLRRLGDQRSAGLLAEQLRAA